MRGGGFKYHSVSSRTRSGFRMGYDWRIFLPKEKTKRSVIKEETDTVSTEKEDVKENDIANSEKLFENLISSSSTNN